MVGLFNAVLRITHQSIEWNIEWICKIYDLDFDYVEIGIEGPEGIPTVINKKRNEISKLLQSFKHKAIGHTAY